MELNINKLLESYLAAIICSKRLLNFRHGLSEFTRKVTRAGHHASFYFDIEDPYSYLLLPVIEELEQAFQISFDIQVVAPRDPSFLPEQDALERYALTDASYLSQAWGLDFPKLIPNQTRLNKEALRLLLYSRSTTGEWIQLAKETSDAYWSGDRNKLHTLIQQNKVVDAFDVPEILRNNTDRFYKRGFYMPASIYYRGEWYWGLDRLYLLRERLQRYHAQEHRTKYYPDWGNVRVPSRPNDPTELFFSFRSPYSYIAIARLAMTPSDYPIKSITLKPVLPMVTRGLPVPKLKKMYILKDAARIAHFEAIQFGRVRDPLGKGVEVAISIFHQTPKEKQLEVAYHLLRDIWAKGQDISSEHYLKEICSRFQLSESAIIKTLKTQSYQEMTDANRAELEKLGLWGVPSFKKGKLVVWGQDRMPLVFEKSFKGKGTAK